MPKPMLKPMPKPMAAPMFRHQVLRRGFSLWSRRTPTSHILKAARNGEESLPAQIQRVRFKRPPIFRTRRLIGPFLFSFLLYTWLGRYVVVEVHDTKDDQWHQVGPDGRVMSADGDEDDDEYDDEDEPETFLFLPTGFPREKKTLGYTRFDPEMKEFLAIARDREESKRILLECAHSVAKLAQRIIPWRDAQREAPPLGRLDFRNAQVLLEIKPPEPAPEYEIPGVAIREDGSVVWIFQPANPAHLTLLWPRPAIRAAWTDLRVKAFAWYHATRAALGLEPWDPRRLFNYAKMHAHPLSFPLDAVAERDLFTPSRSPARTAARRQQTSPAPPNAVQDAPSGPSITLPPPLGNVGLELPSAKTLLPNLTMFKLMWANSHAEEIWRLLEDGVTPQGRIMVRGTIVVPAQFGRVTWMVNAIYDPKAKKFDNILVRLGEIRYLL